MKVFRVSDDQYIFFDEQASVATVQSRKRLEVTRDGLLDAVARDKSKDAAELLEWARAHYPASPEYGMVQTSRLKLEQINAMLAQMENAKDVAKDKGIGVQDG